MISLFLTSSELVDLTERKRKSEQVAWLKENAFPFVIGGNGNPKVFREYVAARLSGIKQASKPEPNWGAI